MKQTTKKETSGAIKKDTLIPIILFGSAIPIALVFWLGNLLVKYINNEDREVDHISPTRWLASIVIPMAFAVYGYRKKNLDKSGALFGYMVGFTLTISSYCFLSCLIAFFFTSSKATKYKSKEKRKFEEGFKEGGQRNWIQVICNGGMATILAFLYMIDYGCGEVPINMKSNYRASWLSLGILGSFACSNGDTWASELGTVFGGSPFLITTRKKVPRGTNGGVTIGGLVFSTLGGVVIGISYYTALLLCIDEHTLSISPNQWPVILVGGAIGLLGSVVDSLLGATLQYSGLEVQSGCVVENPGENVKHISGRRILDNHSVNLLSTFLMGLITPELCRVIWI